MEAKVIGRVRLGKQRRSFKVIWSPAEQDVYVACGGWTWCGQANSAGAAMRRAEAWLFNE